MQHCSPYSTRLYPPATSVWLPARNMSLGVSCGGNCATLGMGRVNHDGMSSQRAHNTMPLSSSTFCAAKVWANDVPEPTLGLRTCHCGQKSRRNAPQASRCHSRKWPSAEQRQGVFCCLQLRPTGSSRWSPESRGGCQSERLQQLLCESMGTQREPHASGTGGTLGSTTIRESQRTSRTLPREAKGGAKCAFRHDGYLRLTWRRGLFGQAGVPAAGTQLAVVSSNVCPHRSGSQSARGKPGCATRTTAAVGRRMPHCNTAVPAFMQDTLAWQS